jgi:predicted Zn-dependent protease
VIAPLLVAARQRAGIADALLKSDDTITLTLDGAGPPVIEHHSGFAACLRLRRDGRVGHAGTVTRDLGELVGRAIRSAEAGPPGELHLPAAAPLPRVATSDRSAATAGTREVLDLARLLRESLPEHAREAEVWAERSAGSVEVGNTRDVLARYECTLVGFGVRLAGAGPRRAPLALHRSGVAWPETLAVQALAAEVTRLLRPPLLGGHRLPEAMRVCFAPAAVRSLLQPLRRALHAAPRDRGPRAGGDPDDPGLPAWLTLTDDPLAPGRPGSRPVDDEGVVALPRTLIERGRVVGRITDLETGIRLGIPATGHGRRREPGAAR